MLQGTRQPAVISVLTRPLLVPGIGDTCYSPSLTHTHTYTCTHARAKSVRYSVPRTTNAVGR